MCLDSSRRCSDILGDNLFVPDSCVADQLIDLQCFSEAQQVYLARVASVYIQGHKT